MPLSSVAYHVGVIIGLRVALTTILAAASAHVAAESAFGYHASFRAGYAWLRCTYPYRCADPIEMRIEIERQRRLQELREQATHPEPRIRPGEGPWGPQRYLPPATPDANIQPEYRDKSKLRPEYEEKVR